MQQDIAKTIARGWSPELREAMALPEQARRLSDALLAALDAANAEAERLEAKEKAS